MIDKMTIAIDGLHSANVLTNSPPDEGQLPSIVFLHRHTPAWHLKFRLPDFDTSQCSDT